MGIGAGLLCISNCPVNDGTGCLEAGSPALNRPFCIGAEYHHLEVLADGPR